MTPTQFKRKLRSKSITMMELIIARIMGTAAESADPVRANFLMERGGAQMKEKKEVTIKPVKYKTDVRPDGGLLQEIVDEEAKREKAIPAGGAPTPVDDTETLRAATEGQVLDAEVTSGAD